MVSSPGKGNMFDDVFWVVVVILLVGGFWVFMGGPKQYTPEGKQIVATTSPTKDEEIVRTVLPMFSENNSRERKETISSRQTKEPQEAVKAGADLAAMNRSPYYGQVTISSVRPFSGSGPFYNEYIILTASRRNKQPIVVSGWRLENDGSQRYINRNGKMVLGSNASVSIPMVTKLLTNTGNSSSTPVFLMPGGRAIIVTGKPVSRKSYALNSGFQVNKCSGYLREFNTTIYPPLSLQCPNYKIEGASEVSLSEACYRFVRSFRTCHVPTVTYDREDRKLLDGKDISSSCERYIDEHFNYAACVKNHQGDSDFYTTEWRVFLNNPWPLWAKDDETVKLYDAAGRLVHSKSY